MTGDISDVVGRQPRIEGVADRSHAGNRVVEFEMTVAVHGHRRNAVAECDAKSAQHAHQAPASALQRGVSGSNDAAVLAAGDDLTLRMMTRRVSDDG
jgi:hypothetical protein